MSVKSVTALHELDEEIKNNKNVFLMVVASWSKPSINTKPYIMSFVEDKKYESIQFVEVDVDECDEITHHYKIKCIPSYIAIAHGCIAQRIAGNDERIIKTTLNQLI